MTSWRRDTGREGEHEQVLALLPWYANGSLEAEEAGRVEDHLETCPECAREVLACRRLAAALEASEEEGPSPHPVQLARLMARIDAYEASGGRLRALGRGLLGRGPGGRLRRWGGSWRRAPRPLRWALTAQLAALLVLTGLLLGRGFVGPTPDAPAVYRTLSDPPPAAAAAPRLRIVFAEGTNEGEMRRLLLSVRAEIVAGPSPFGAYTLRLVPSDAGGDSRDAVVAFLRSEPVVRFVEAIPALGPG